MRHILLLIGCLLVTSAWGYTYTFKNNTKHDFTLKLILKPEASGFCRPHIWEKIPRAREGKPGEVSISTGGCCADELYLRAAKGDGNISGVARIVEPPKTGRGIACQSFTAELSEATRSDGGATFAVEYQT